MIAVTQNLEPLYKMLSASDRQEKTRFGELLIRIMKKPHIPENKDLLFHPSPTLNKSGQPRRLQKSKLSVSEYAEVRQKWVEIIADRNKYPDSHGLSYDMFLKMIRDLYGCDDIRSPEMPITREAVDHLIHTANPKTKTKPAATVQEFNLKFMSCFSQDHTFEELKAVGEEVVAAYVDYKQQLRNKTRAIQAGEPIKLTFDLVPPKVDQEDKVDAAFFSHKGKLTGSVQRANNLRTLLFDKLQEKGSSYFVNSETPLDEILAILADESPKLSPKTFVCLPELLEISLETFVKLLTKDKDDLNLGF